jgi:calmodulin
MLSQRSENKKAKSIKSLQNILEDPLKIRYLTKEMFKLMDIDASNYIDLSEMYNYMVEVSKIIDCATPNLEDVKDVVSTFDMDGDQRISLEEFEIFVREIIEKMIDREYSSLSTKTKSSF